MSDKKPTMQDIKKSFYSADNVEAGTVAANAALELVEADKGTSVLNFDPEQEFPTGYGLVVGPINKRDAESKKTKVIGVYVAAVPDVALLQSTPEGVTWITEQLHDAVTAKVANAVRPRTDGSTAASVPFTVEDFITSNRPEGLLVAFNKLAPNYVKVLKDKGLKMMTVAILRQILQSAAFADQQFPKIPQETWLKMLNSMIAAATKAELVPGNLEDWVESRDTAGLPQDEDVDLSDLDFGAL